MFSAVSGMNPPPGLTVRGVGVTESDFSGQELLAGCFHIVDREWAEQDAPCIDVRSGPYELVSALAPLGFVRHTSIEMQLKDDEVHPHVHEECEQSSRILSLSGNRQRVARLASTSGRDGLRKLVDRFQGFLE